MNKPLESKKFVICVDDEPEILEAIAKNIRACNYEPLLANSGAEAFGLLEKNFRDTVLILSDYQMPDMHGLELRAKMLAEYKQIPFVLISGHISREDALRAVELKISGFISKPFINDEMIKLINDHSADRLASLKEEEVLILGFVTDTENLVEEMESLLLALEENPADFETISRIFSIAHTIKGASGFFYPKTIHHFTQAFEDFLTPYKKNLSAMPMEALAVLRKGLSIIKSLLPVLRDRCTDPTPLEDLLMIFQTPMAASSAVKNSPQPNTGDEIKVPLTMLDSFMEFSGEMTVIRNMVNKLVRAVEREIPGSHNMNLLSSLLQEMYKTNGQMLDKIVGLRKVNGKNIFQSLKRIIRDQAGNTKKEIYLETTGENLRVDMAIANTLINSLIPIVRNCVDHSIELPEERKSCGKPPAGTISIEIKEENKEITVKVSDDGKGIDPELIHHKVEEKIITDSGGRIEISPSPGIGSNFHIFIPIPKVVSIISSLYIRSGHHQIAVPQENLVRLLSFPSEQRKERICNMESADFICLDKDLIPILNLEAILSPDGKSDPFCTTNNSKEVHFVIVSSEEGQLALMVDEIYDVEDTVVKKLGSHLQNLHIFQGATFLDDGGVGLILDISGLAQYAKVKGMKSSPRSKDTNKIISHKQIKKLLLLELEKPGLFGIFLEDIFRLENFNASELQYSGDIDLILYRGETCPIFSADQLLGYTKSKIPAQGSLPALIFSIHGSCWGISIKQIVDLVISSATIDAELADREGISGAILHNNKIVTILDTHGLLALAQKKLIYHDPQALAA